MHKAHRSLTQCTIDAVNGQQIHRRLTTGKQLPIDNTQDPGQTHKNCEEHLISYRTNMVCYTIQVWFVIVVENL